MLGKGRGPKSAAPAGPISRLVMVISSGGEQVTSFKRCNAALKQVRRSTERSSLVRCARSSPQR